ncbi:FkbM family methyltransferase [Candidatus Uabimicrobium amorphum]|uniref:Methyltransferase FkbM domain-containing protein n=1 Tax=Uabimicrobium amorphum TaxID=2596890 RepID=A0A5S9ISY3_UABAM|nr:FkbM family methyltransferase [Candidatus Uabimicrobium amorphum]BBM87354.1 hypothetical protein UABAM_05763 [Candidatus Uabimicrobium amorphum]
MLKNSSTFKIIIKKILCFAPVNKLLQWILRPFISFLPQDLSRIPVIGTVKFSCDRDTLLMRGCGNDTIATALFWRGMAGFEPHTMEVFKKLLRHSNVFLDIGANTGIYSLIAAKKGVVVHAFEAVPDIFHKSLLPNLALNEMDEVHTHCCAISDEPSGFIELYIPHSTAIPTSASTVAGFKENCKCVQVPQTTIDHFVANQSLDTVDLLKIDVEGAELKVLNGCKDTLLNHKPFVICEVLPGKEQGIQSFFSTAQYAFFHITTQGLVEKDVVEASSEHLNYLFVSHKRLDEFRGIFDNL